jgi:menaquinone-dependent protoporphyrinogen IX oxidase
MNAPSPLLVAYATKYDSTREVAETIAEILRGCGHDVACRVAGHVRALGRFDVIARRVVID